MAAKYGAPDATDPEGFDPYADTVGAGIYSGDVVRNAETGAIVIGAQYQQHNRRPGPVYSGRGYSRVSKGIASFAGELRRPLARWQTTLGRLFQEDPGLANAVATGGALPLHTCGMSRANQLATAFVIEAGGDLDALDTYGYTPLHRMASNNLAVGAQALLDAGADPLGLAQPGRPGVESPRDVAVASGATDVLKVLDAFASAGPASASSVRVTAAGGYDAVIGRYLPRDGGSEVPAAFAAVCAQNGWDVQATWARLNGGAGGVWFAHEDSANESYIYFNGGDKMWWIDGPDGLGAFKAPGPSWAPPCSETAWLPLREGVAGPTLLVHRG